MCEPHSSRCKPLACRSKIFSDIFWALEAEAAEAEVDADQVKARTDRLQMIGDFGPHSAKLFRVRTCQEIHTPRDPNRKHLGAAQQYVIETPEKPTLPKSKQEPSEAIELFSQKTWNIPGLNSEKNLLNADADEFIPGSLVSSFLPAILPSVPAPLHNTCMSMVANPPGLEMRGMSSIWEEATTQFGESAWEQSTLSTRLSSFPASEASPNHLADEGEENQTVRTVRLVSCLLRFLMQAPVLETSDLLKVIESQLGEAQDSGPWCQRDLKKVLFSYKDLALLDGRLASLLHKLSPEVVARLSGQAKLNMTWESPGIWSFKEPPELRRLIRKTNMLKTKTTSAQNQFSITFLSQRSGCLPMELDRMLKFKRAGIACLQGLDSSDHDLAASIFGKGYGRFCAQGSGEANTIIWDRSLWTFCASHECNAGLAVDLTSQGQTIRVACLRPTLEHSCEADFADFLLSENVNLVVCVDLSLLGGTSSAGLVPALLGLHSAMFETLGHEVLVPKPSASNEPDADDLNPLWDPCGIFFSGVEPMAALSGYTEGYLATLSQSKMGDSTVNFPQGKPILFAEFGLNGFSQDFKSKK